MSMGLYSQTIMFMVELLLPRLGNKDDLTISPGWKVSPGGTRNLQLLTWGESPTFIGLFMVRASSILDMGKVTMYLSISLTYRMTIGMGVNLCLLLGSLHISSLSSHAFLSFVQHGSHQPTLISKKKVGGGVIIADAQDSTVLLWRWVWD